MMKKVFILLILLVLFLFTQCSGELFEPVMEDPQFSVTDRGAGASSPSAEADITEAVSNKGAGKGAGKGGANGDSGSGIYGDLIVCLRDANGVPLYLPITGEHGETYYPLPIKFDEATLYPVMDGLGFYETFQLSDEGDVIPEEGYLVKEVDFGRLNVVRAPQSVLDQALDEAIANLTQPGVTGYRTDASGRLVAIIGAEDWIVNYDPEEAGTPEEYDDKTIDSPRENIAIYQELMSRQFTGRLNFLISNSFRSGEQFTALDLHRLASGAVAAGADKTGILTVDELAYMNNWLLDLTADAAINSPDGRDRYYYNFTGFQYNRHETYRDKYVRRTILSSDGTWDVTYESLLEAVEWTDPVRLVHYGNENANITGFSKAANDAIQVLEYIHESDLVVYSPYFTADGPVTPSLP